MPVPVSLSSERIIGTARYTTTAGSVVHLTAGLLGYMTGWVAGPLAGFVAARTAVAETAVEVLLAGPAERPARGIAEAVAAVAAAAAAGDWEFASYMMTVTVEQVPPLVQAPAAASRCLAAVGRPQLFVEAVDQRNRGM